MKAWEAFSFKCWCVQIARNNSQRIRSYALMLHTPKNAPTRIALTLAPRIAYDRDRYDKD